MEMQGKNAVVTGGSRGIGRAISEEFASQGANIIIADIQEDLAESAAKEIADSFGIKPQQSRLMFLIQPVRKRWSILP